MTFTPLHYRRTGRGPHVLLLFHGFGQDHTAFQAWQPDPAAFSVYSFDLYYHGTSTRPDEPLTKTEWQAAVAHFLETEGLRHFSVAGFSLGGRFAIATAIAFPQHIRHLILVAPDGIFMNPWYRFATGPVGNPLFRYLMHHPDRFFRWLRVFEWLRMASPMMIRFAQRELQDQSNCQRVYRTWTYFRPLQHRPATLCQMLTRHQISCTLVLGTKDRIIPPEKVLPHLQGTPSLQAHVLGARHHELLEEAAGLVLGIFKSGE